VAHVVLELLKEHYLQATAPFFTTDYILEEIKAFLNDLLS